MRIESFPQQALPATRQAQLLGLRDQAWPRADDEPPTSHDPLLDPVAVLLIDGDDVVAALDILSTRLTHQGESYAASGLSTVVTDTARRGRGHGHRLVTAARELIERGGADLGLFTCDRPLAPFYERAGWTVLPGTTLVGGTPEAPFPSDQFDKLTLAAFFTGHARRNARGFEHARIELYPGTIDRLW